VTAAEKIRVMVVDDHPVTRLGVTAMINAQLDMLVVAQAGTGQEATEMFWQHKPHVTLMDLRLPGMSGVEAIRAIRARDPHSRFVVLTTYEGDEDIHQALAQECPRFSQRCNSESTGTGGWVPGSAHLIATRWPCLPASPAICQ
jgi:DNA-binding NarL/FixJ family response regulator